jgi:hypothetical protein
LWAVDTVTGREIGRYEDTHTAKRLGRDTSLRRLSRDNLDHVVSDNALHLTVALHWAGAAAVKP